MEWFRQTWQQAQEIWSDGGWAMFVIAGIAMFLFAMGCHVALNLRARRFRAVPEKRWRAWIHDREARRGHLGWLLNQVTGFRTHRGIVDAFRQLRKAETLPFERDLRVMKICVSAAPLVGLLGTVTGMLTTFDGLSEGSGGDRTLGNIAVGISEALVTTMTGLVIALPGLYFQHGLQRRFESYKAFLAHLESVVSRALHQEQRDLEHRNREALRRAIAKAHLSEAS